MTGRARIPGIFLYPIKSSAGIAVGDALVEPRGFAGDWTISTVACRRLWTCADSGPTSSPPVEILA